MYSYSKAHFVNSDGDGAAAVGWSKEIKPVPKSGKINFSDIGNLAVLNHSGAMNISLRNDGLQQMIAEQGKEPIDPADFRGAIWCGGKEIVRGENLPPPNPNEWNFALENNFPGSRSQANWDESEGAMRLVADTRSGDNQLDWNKKNATVLVYYVGRFAAGTRIKAEVTLKNRNQEPYGEVIHAHVRGWENGWHNGIYHEYADFEKNPRYMDYEEKSAEFTVLSGYPDIWVTCEVESNSPRYSEGKQNIGFFKDWKLSLA